MITPEQFVSILRQTTLTLEEQVHVLEMLPTLEQDEIQQLVKTLTKDAKRKQKMLSRYESGMEKIMIGLEGDFEKRLKKEEKAQQ